MKKGKKKGKSLIGLFVLLVGLSLVLGCSDTTIWLTQDDVHTPDRVLNADVVVVGGGGTGFTAALVAAQQGLNVIVVEQMFHTGGNTIMAGGAHNFVRTDANHATITADGDHSVLSGRTYSAPMVNRMLNMTVNDEEFAWIFAELPAYIKERAAQALPGWQAGLQRDWDHFVTHFNIDFSPGVDDWFPIFDSIYLHTLNTFYGGDFAGIPELAHMLSYYGYEATRWLIAAGAYFRRNASDLLNPSNLTGSLYHRNWWVRSTPEDRALTRPGVDPLAGAGNLPGAGYVAPQQASFMRLKRDRGLGYWDNILLGHRAEMVIMEDGRPVGIRGTHPGGVFQINARAVLVATGGFGGNWELMERFNPRVQAQLAPAREARVHPGDIPNLRAQPAIMTLKWPNLSLYQTTNDKAAADGRFMMAVARDTGARLHDMGEIQILPTLGAGNFRVDEMGNRTFNENGRRDQGAMAFVHQNLEGRALYAITRGNPATIAETADPNHPAYCRHAARSLGARILNHSRNWGFTTAGAGAQLPADINEAALAALLNAEQNALVNQFADNFIAEVWHYNYSVRAGVPCWTGKTVRQNGQTRPGPGPAGTPGTDPWGWTLHGQGNIHHTMGGLLINAQTQVIHENGNVIPGLFAAGEVIGGLHARNRLGGNAITDILAFGYIMGNEAAKFLNGN